MFTQFWLKVVEEVAKQLPQVKSYVEQNVSAFSAIQHKTHLPQKHIPIHTLPNGAAWRCPNISNNMPYSSTNPKDLEGIYTLEIRLISSCQSFQGSLLHTAELVSPSSNMLVKIGTCRPKFSLVPSENHHF